MVTAIWPIRASPKLVSGCVISVIVALGRLRFCSNLANSSGPRAHNRFRDLDERWKSASTGRRNRLPHLLRQTIDPSKWGRRFRLPFQRPQSMVGILLISTPGALTFPPSGDLLSLSNPFG